MLILIVEQGNDHILTVWNDQPWLVGGACDVCMMLVSV